MNRVPTPQEVVATTSIFPYAVENILRFLREGKRFVHYSSAEAAEKIIGNECVWFRNARLMNDFSEIEHGKQCLEVALASQAGLQLKNLLRQKSERLSAILESFPATLSDITEKTYLFCLSEHAPEDDLMGRLSMWRGYGGAADSVAVVLNTAPFLSGAVDISPVGYFDQGQFLSQFQRVMKELPNALNGLSVDMLHDRISVALTAAVTCTKHPGFREEQEWRLIYRPSSGDAGILVEKQVSYGGREQTVFEAPLKNRPDLGLQGVKVGELVHRVIIGPSEQPETLKEKFIALLSSKGVKSAETRVINSNIPFRRNIPLPS